jgi:hypothetical protein
MSDAFKHYPRRTADAAEVRTSDSEPSKKNAKGSEQFGTIPAAAIRDLSR